MNDSIRVDIINSKIIVSQAFADKCRNCDSEEYKLLQKVKSENEGYSIKLHDYKKNPAKKAYRGLTFDTMEEYILAHGSDEEVTKSISEYRELRRQGKLQRERCFPAIKSWFLDKYPEVKQFGLRKSAETDVSEDEVDFEEELAS